jgi:ComF family protein
MGRVVNDAGGEIKRFWRTLARWPADVLFPPVCPGCRRQVAQPGTLCGKCWPRLRLLERPWCEVTGLTFSCDMGEGLVSAEAIANPPAYDRARAAVAYTDIARRMVQGLKFRDRTELAPWMARWMARAGKELIDECAVVVPVPLHRARFLFRGFNQAAELARALAARSGLEYAPQALTRVRSTRQQIGLGQAQRERNVRGAFRVPDGARIHIQGRRVLLVDDVLTTGATVSACARALKRSGARAVDVLAFARALPGDFRDDRDGSI